MPDTDIWLLKAKWSYDSLSITDPVNITNRSGYDNQPVFSPDGKYILYTSVRDKKSDIWKYDIKKGKHSQFTNTPNTAEYSPTFLPGKRGVSVVMVEADDSTQRIWKFPLKGGNAPSVLFSNFDSIGYHCWLSDKQAVVFLLTSPFSLQYISDTAQRPVFIDSDIGRCIKNDKGVIVYTRKQAEGKNDVFLFGPAAAESLPAGYYIESEDFDIYDTKMIYGWGSQVWLSDLHQNGKKMMMADLKDKGIKNISRIAISGDGSKIAIVAEKVK